MFMFGCQSYPPLPTVSHVDVPRFMGRWYVIAHVPASVEENAYNATETYRLEDDGSIATTFKFREGGFDGEEKTMTPRGFVTDDPSNAVWGMRFIWPINAEYLIADLDAEYQTTIVARTKRDYAWIMARKPKLPVAEYDRLVARLVALGYDLSRVRRVPQRWE
jgi:apolipoprotein D and lipocalin family protein